MNKLNLILAILLLNGCQTVGKYYQCEKDKNYFNVNNDLFNEYKNNYENGNIKSYYFDIDGKCELDICFREYKNLDFFEYKFDNNHFKGIYRVDILKEYNNEKCYYKKINKDNICYLMNKIEKPTSRYHVFLRNNQNINIMYLLDKLYSYKVTELSYQVYTEASISGAPTGSICDLKRNKNDYKLQIFEIPYR